MNFFRLSTWEMMQCIFSTFIDYQDISRDTFLLAKMILAAGGLMALSSYKNAASMFAILVKQLFSLLLIKLC